MKHITVLKYADTALPTNSDTVVLFSEGAYAQPGMYQLQGAGDLKYVLRLRNSHAGTLKIEKSDDNSTFTVIHQQDVPASSTNHVNKFAIAVNGYPFFRVRWTNGGTTQTTFDPMQCLAYDENPGGQHQEMAARLRGPVTDATNNFAYQAGTTHAVYAIPTDWLGRRVDISVVGTALTAAGLAPTVWFLFGTSSSMEVDRSVFVTGTPPAFTGSVKIGRPIGHGETKDYYVDPSWTHFSAESDTASTGFYIFPSDYPPQVVD